MNRRAFLICGIALLSIAGRLQAAEPDPTGTWKWKFTNPNNNQTREQSVKLKLDGTTLTGTVSGPQGAEVKIDNASFKDGQVSFSVTRERNNQKVTTKFSGKVEDDTITGKTETERPNGQGQSRDWVAKRDKS